MKKNRLSILGALLAISLANLSRMSILESIRAVGFLSIFAVGLLAGALLLALTDKFKNKE